MSGPRDLDGDGFKETLGLSAADAGAMLFQDKPELHKLLQERLGSWDMLPSSQPPPAKPAPTVDPTPATPSDLLCPERCVRSRLAVAVRTTVPEAAMDENAEAFSWERKVRSSR
jgi:hypothetical protein